MNWPIETPVFDGREVALPGGVRLELMWVTDCYADSRVGLPQDRSNTHNHCLYKGFLQWWAGAVLGTLPGPFSQRLPDDPGVNTVTARLDFFLAHFPKEGLVPLLEGLRGRRIAFRQTALQDLEAAGEGEPIRIELLAFCRVLVQRNVEFGRAGVSELRVD